MLVFYSPFSDFPWLFAGIFFLEFAGTDPEFASEQAIKKGNIVKATFTRGFFHTVFSTGKQHLGVM